MRVWIFLGFFRAAFPLCWRWVVDREIGGGEVIPSDQAARERTAKLDLGGCIQLTRDRGDVAEANLGVAFPLCRFDCRPKGGAILRLLVRTCADHLGVDEAGFFAVVRVSDPSAGGVGGRRDHGLAG